MYLDSRCISCTFVVRLTELHQLFSSLLPTLPPLLRLLPLSHTKSSELVQGRTKFLAASSLSVKRSSEASLRPPLGVIPSLPHSAAEMALYDLARALQHVGHCFGSSSLSLGINADAGTVMSWQMAKCGKGDNIDWPSKILQRQE